MTTAEVQAYVKAWAETGRLLEEQRWAELRALDSDRAREASRHLIAAALLVPLPERRRGWSGLVDQQDALHRRQERPKTA